MQFKGLRRCGEQVSGEETEALLAHIHLRELVCERTDARRLIDWSLAKPWLVDVLRLWLRSSIVRRLPCLAHLLLCELALRRETGSEELRRLRRLAWELEAGTALYAGPAGPTGDAIVSARYACV